MFLKLSVRLSLAAIFVAAAVPLFSQVVPAATQGGLPLVVGGGVSGYYSDWVNPIIKGPAAWVDWTNYHGPKFLHGLGIEAEGRDLNYGQPANVRLRMYSFGGGPIYTWHHYRNLKLYGKFLLDYGAMDFDIGIPGYTHDHWTTYAPGGGAEYRAWRNVWVRVDYEYQFWRLQFYNNNFLSPEGLTLGVSYDLRQLHRH